MFILKIDINECNGDNDCDHNCNNTQGSYTCYCDTGYELLNTTHCIDTDECSDNNGGCEHQCNNTVGSYECSCYGGYTLDCNGLNCSGKLVYTCTANTVYM